MKEIIEESVLAEFFKLLHRLHQCRPCFKKHGELANVEFYILMELSLLSELNGGEITLGDIIKRTDMTMSAASKKITILEKKGLVTREPSAKDRRNINIKLTSKGEALCEDEKEKKRAWMSEVLDRMGEEDARQLFRLVNKMLDTIEEIETENEENAELEQQLNK